MKILFCTNVFENITNGPVRFANIVLDINQLHPGHELRILTEDISDSRLATLRQVHRVTVKVPFLLKPLGQILRWFIYYRQIKQVQRQFDYDVIVFINSFNGLWASLLSDKPTVGMINDEKNMLATWQNFSPKPLWIKRFAFQKLEKLSAHKHKLIITNSNFLTKRVMDTYNLPATRVQKLYKSIPLDDIDFNPNRSFDAPYKILFVKADYMVGQLPTVAQALKQLSQYQFLLTVVGPEPQFEAHLRSLFTGIANITLNYVGAQPQERVYELMRVYDVFCVPSYTEAFGVANIEALAHGLSVISSQVGGIPEVLDQGNNGWLVTPSDPNSLAEAIEDCIKNPAKRLEKAQNGRTFIRRFSKTEMLRDFVSMLQSVV